MVSVLTLAEAKTHLNITATTHDAELQDVIDAAEAVISKRVGPLQATVRTARVQGGGTRLVLPEYPVTSLTTVTPADSDALTVGDLSLDSAAGVVTYTSGARFGARWYDVAYSAGRATCPDDLLMAVKELVRHMWDTQRGPARRPGSTASDVASNTLPGAGYLLPFRVSELIAPHESVGFA